MIKYATGTFMMNQLKHAVSMLISVT